MMAKQTKKKTVLWWRRTTRVDLYFHISKYTQVFKQEFNVLIKLEYTVLSVE